MPGQRDSVETHDLARVWLVEGRMLSQVIWVELQSEGLRASQDNTSDPRRHSLEAWATQESSSVTTPSRAFGVPPPSAAVSPFLSDNSPSPRWSPEVDKEGVLSLKCWG